jgi:hypothetical protein
MPVLETTDKITPRSALRYRPIKDDGAAKEPNPGVANPTTPIVKRASRLRQPDTGDEVAEWKRADDSETQDGDTSASKSAGRASTTSKVPPKTRLAARTVTRKQQLLQVHPLLYLGLGMLAMLALLAAFIMVTNWVTITLDDIHYGRPRTFQIDAFVGHNESTGMPSHFIALNLHGRIEIIELPGGDPTHAHVYLGPQLYGTDADLVPVTLSFIDVNGDHRPDMIIHFQGTQVVFINDQGGFRPLRPEERTPVEQFLQQHGQ